MKKMLLFVMLLFGGLVSSLIAADLINLPTPVTIYGDNGKSINGDSGDLFKIAIGQKIEDKVSIGLISSMWLFKEMKKYGVVSMNQTGMEWKSESFEVGWGTDYDS